MIKKTKSASSDQISASLVSQSKSTTFILQFVLIERIKAATATVITILLSSNPCLSLSDA